MKTLLRLFQVLFVLAFCFSCSQAGGASASGFQLTIELRDGSRVIGKTPNENLDFHSATLGDLKLSWAAIRAIDYTANADTAQLTATNGDGINVKPFADTVRVETSYGKNEIPMKLVKSIKVAAVAKPGQLPDGLVALWSGEGDARDSASGQMAKVVGGVGYAPGKVGQAFSFNGSSSYVLISNSPSLNPTGGFSIECWIYPTRDADQKILSKWGDEGDYVNNRSYGLRTIPGFGLSFDISDLANQCDQSFQIFEVNGVLTLNAWNHVAATYDSATGIRRLYVNGVNVASHTNAPVAVYDSITPVTIGAFMRSPDTTRDYFQGLIDELAIYNRALSDDEIQAIYTEQR